MSGRIVDTGLSANSHDPFSPPERPLAGPDNVVNKRSLEYAVKSGLAGGVAGCAAKTVVAPIERVRILFQTANPQFVQYSGTSFGLVAATRHIIRSQGLSGLFKGHSAALLRVFPHAGVSFLAYEQYRALVLPSRDRESPFRRLLAGSLAGVTATLMTYPLELIRVRLAYETRQSHRTLLARICRQIYDEPYSKTSAKSWFPPGNTTTTQPENVIYNNHQRAGLRGFYRGFAPTVMGMIPYAGTSFMTHDVIRDWFRSPAIATYTTIPSSGRGDRRAKLTAAAELFAGAIAGIIAQTASYPIESIRRRMQVGGIQNNGRHIGIAATAQKIYREKGWRGFFVGLGLGYMKMVPLTATSFFVYDRLKEIYNL
ncbi:mitochondrial carrier domain-containing protein [Xylariales sp. PMI_506]|nr:mitochondrial carrier domain-containing protein [Xylariales sp. PMI_506]